MGTGGLVACDSAAESPAPTEPAASEPEFEDTGLRDVHEVERDLEVKVLEEIVPLVLADGEPVPDVDDRGQVRDEKTPVDGPFIDQPMPVQALRLCTLVRDELDLGVRSVTAHDSGVCRVDAGERFTVAAEFVLPTDVSLLTD